MKIGIVGYGVVGKALHKSLLIPNVAEEINIYDPLYESPKIKLEKNDAIFMCVPTPTVLGHQDLRAIFNYSKYLSKKKYTGLVIIKSSIIPNIIKGFIDDYNMRFIFSPEFLDQHNPYIEQKHVIGCSHVVDADAYCKIFGILLDQVMITNPTTAMMIKYTHNCFGALKVTFFNEIYDICEKLGVNYREMIHYMLQSTEHISSWYTRMSADGKRGFGGKCFPDNVSAFCNMNDVKTLKAALNKNEEYRYSEMEGK